ncbi:MAG: hypothetical protein ACM3RP_00250 [Chitinophagales bacterium]
MGKSPKKRSQHSFYERFGKAKEPRVARELHEPIRVGLCLTHPVQPRCLWRGDEVIPIYRVVKRWTDSYRNLWYRVKTDQGTFDIYEHRQWLSRAEKVYRSHWFLAAEIEMVPLRHTATADEPSRAGRDGTTRTGRGDSSSRRTQTPGNHSRKM